MVRLKIIWSLLCSFLILGSVAASAAPDMARFTPILIKEFDTPPVMFDGTTGVWKDYPRRQRFIGNGPVSLYVNPGMVGQDGQPLGLDAISTQDGVLTIQAAPIPLDKKADVHAILQKSGYKENQIAKVRYSSGLLSTRASWAQTYGYFEMRARLPEGQGHWPAFWLTPVTPGWPPEIDIFEVLGRQNGVDAPRTKDNLLHAHVHFDETGPDGKPLAAEVFENPFNIVDGAPEQAKERSRKIGPRYAFGDSVAIGSIFGRDLFDQFNVFALSWTPQEITWWFGPSHDELTEIYRVATPNDVHSPMSVIINNQIGGTWAYAPRVEDDATVFAQKFEIDYVKLYALTPPLVDQNPPRSGSHDTASAGRTIMGDTHNEEIMLSGEFNIVSGGGGADRFVLGVANLSTLFLDFQTDDVVVFGDQELQGTPEFLNHLVQVGSDVWFVDGDGATVSRTMIFRDTVVADFLIKNFELATNP